MNLSPLAADVNAAAVAAPVNRCLPAQAGIGLKPAHIAELLRQPAATGFVEIHAENYLVAGGPLHSGLRAVCEHYPLAVHGVGLSIGGEAPLDRDHLKQVASLVERYQPAVFSEHLAWSTHSHAFLNDLLPLPYTRETLSRVCDHIDQVQEALRRPMLLENPSTYVEFNASTLSETTFISEIVRRTGCGLLLDVNNLYISAVNHHRDAQHMLSELPLDRVGEIHLAGYAEAVDDAGDRLLIDSHDRAVSDAVWALYEQALAGTGAVATLIEWDGNVPSLARLLQEAARAQSVIDREACHATRLR
ncbi:MNIO family bufferin maturase [Candidatus Pantoea soli]|uniref:UPF0276 protein D8B20_18550 n=1 Tax=Candidatus Pantoea soli TaxID=3098669 RepID=A0A518XIA5_9GAMM|nr:DUF692 domain-containing protein [Pantoea soli]QDY43930.1 DUF692 domain-containing protein [Pantoea soli]